MVWAALWELGTLAVSRGFASAVRSGAAARSVATSVLRSAAIATGKATIKTLKLADNKYFQGGSLALSILESVTEEDHLPEEVEDALYFFGMIGLVSGAGRLLLKGSVNAAVSSARQMSSSALKNARRATAAAMAASRSGYMSAMKKLPLVGLRTSEQVHAFASIAKMSIEKVTPEVVKLAGIRVLFDRARGCWVSLSPAKGVLCEYSQKGLTFVQAHPRASVTAAAGVAALGVAFFPAPAKEGEESSGLETMDPEVVDAIHDMLVQASILSNPDLLDLEPLRLEGDFPDLDLLIALDDPRHLTRAYVSEGYSYAMAQRLALRTLAQHIVRLGGDSQNVAIDASSELEPGTSELGSKQVVVEDKTVERPASEPGFWGTAKEAIGDLYSSIVPGGDELAVSSSNEETTAPVKQSADNTTSEEVEEDEDEDDTSSADGTTVSSGSVSAFRQ